MTPLVLRSPLRRLRRDRSGVAMVEFALAAPLLLVLMTYGIETANMAITILRVHQVAATAADNAARVRDAITENDINEVLLGGAIVGGDKPSQTAANYGRDFSDNGRIILSAVAPNGLTGSNAGQVIVWQRCTGSLDVADSRPKYGAEGKGKADGSLPYMGASTRRIAASSGSVAVFAEVTYRYQPIFSARVLGQPIIRSEAAFTVRERNSEALDTGTAKAVSGCA